MAYREHTVERWSRQLAQRLTSTAEHTAKSIQAPHRPPFHEQLSPRETLAWWLKHRYDHFGQSVLARMDPIQTAQLDAWLAHVVQAVVPGGQTGKLPNQDLPNPNGIISRAMTAEGREYGQPVGPELA